jgi:IS5 family transposase
MRPFMVKDSGQQDLFRSRLDQIINLKHPLVQLSLLLDWDGLHKSLSVYYSDFGRPGLPVRLILGLHLLKYIYGLSDEEVFARWEENPYFQYFCGESFFCHGLPGERSSMTHFRNRIPAEVLERVMQESLAAAHKAGALSLKDLRRVVVDTTVQEKAITHPTEHGLLMKAVHKLGQAAKDCGLNIRQSYQGVVKKASLMAGRYLHAKQMRRAKKQIKFIRTRLGRLIRDVSRKAENQLKRVPEHLSQTLERARHIFLQKRGDKNYRYSWHAPEVECISKGKARTPYEFGVKVALSTTLKAHAKGGKHFILSACAIHGRPYDGHTLAPTLEQIKRIIGCNPDEGYADKGYRGHKLKGPTRIILSGQKRGITQVMKQQMKRRSVIEPIIGHAKNEGHLGRHHLKGRKGDQLNALFSAIGFNLRQLLAFLNTNRQSLSA